MQKEKLNILLKRDQNDYVDCGLLDVFDPMEADSFTEILELYRHHKKYIKFRLFDTFFYPPLGLNEYEHYVHIEEKDYRSVDVLNTFDKSSPWQMFITCKNINLISYISGFYLTEKYVVFCGLPGFNTLKNSIKKDKDDTLSKLQVCYNAKKHQLNQIVSVLGDL